MEEFEEDKSQGLFTNNSENGTIIRDKPPVHRGYPVTQKQIDDILDNELKDYNIIKRPVYNSRLRSQGKTTASFYPWGEVKEILKIEIGKQNKDTKECLIDSIIHE